MDVEAAQDFAYPSPFPATLFRETHDYLKLDLKGQEYIHIACSGILPPILPEEGSKQRACGVPIL